MKAKNHALAFFLSFIPGVGFIYVDRKVRGFLYGFTFFGLLLSGLALYFLVASGIPLLAAAGTAGLVFFIQMIDMTVFLVKKEQEGKEKNSGENGHRNERFSTLLLSLIPGLGHFHLGLMNRGLTFLIAAFGVGMMVIFIVIMTGQTSFIIFLGILMIIWIMNLFDIIHLLDRMDRGENIADRTILEDLE